MTDGVDQGLLALAALRELLAVVDETNERGEPMIGNDHTGTVNWLLDFADRVRPIAAKGEKENL